MKIVFLDSASVGETDFSPLLEIGQLTLYPSTAPENVIERMHDCDIVITNKVIIGQKTIDACPSVKLICIAATGMNNVDLNYAEKKGVTVMNVAGYSTNSVAQVTFALIFQLMNQVDKYDNYVKLKLYSSNSLFTYHGLPFNEIAGKTFGIIGLGTIGKQVANIARAFGANVIYYSTSGKNKNGDFKNVSLLELLKQSDIVSIHAPLNDGTANLISTKELRLMKPSAILINTGRGGIVNEHDLALALDNKTLTGAGVDVFSTEPLPKENPLLSLKHPERIALTPHIAWASIESRKLLIQKIANNIKDFQSHNNG